LFRPSAGPDAFPEQEVCLRGVVGRLLNERQIHPRGAQQDYFRFAFEEVHRSTAVELLVVLAKPPNQVGLIEAARSSDAKEVVHDGSNGTELVVDQVELEPGKDGSTDTPVGKRARFFTVNGTEVAIGLLDSLVEGVEVGIDSGEVLATSWTTTNESKHREGHVQVYAGREWVGCPPPQS
jgi:hypothetical protein